MIAISSIDSYLWATISVVLGHIYALHVLDSEVEHEIAPLVKYWVSDDEIARITLKTSPTALEVRLEAGDNRLEVDNIREHLAEFRVDRLSGIMANIAVAACRSKVGNDASWVQLHLHAA